MQTVAIVQRVLPHYRRPFFEQLREALKTLGVNLRLIYGSPDVAHSLKNDTVDIPWARKIENVSFRIGKSELVWQPCLKELRGTDLVIVEQANSLLLNYVLLAGNLFHLRKLAFWGHGHNFQGKNRNSMPQVLKEKTSRSVHWWFAYNDLSTRVVKSLGFPEDRITSVQNAIDTSSLVEGSKAIQPADMHQLRESFHIAGQNVCIFTGAMYKEKRINFLLDSLLHIKNQISDFEMIFLGDGPDSSKVRAAASKYPWIHYIGTKFGDEKLPFFSISKLLLMPGLVGLAVLDAFALEVPMITTDVSYHSPEIDYLKSGFNGLVVPQANDPEQYAAAVSRLLLHSRAREDLVQGCRFSRQRYTIDEMVRRFSGGVARALCS